MRTQVWVLWRYCGMCVICPVAFTCHHKVLFCVLCVCVLCMHLCTVHMHLSMHNRLTRLLARAARPGSVWECVEGSRIHVHVCLSVHVCSLIVFWAISYWHVTESRIDFLFFFPRSLFSPASVQKHFRLSSESHTAPGRASGSTMVSSVLHLEVYITDTLFSLVPKLQWFFSIFLDVCFVLLSRPINVLFLTN